MNENIIPVNNEALARALEAVVGAENAALVVKAYQVIDKAMADGFAQGVASMTKAYEEQKDQSYDQGYVDGETTAYDDGYVDGVSDARLYPQEADARVALLISGDAFDPSEYTSEDCADWWNDQSDSGDENDAN